jgi:hypothetical protein
MWTVNWLAIHLARLVASVVHAIETFQLRESERTTGR